MKKIIIIGGGPAWLITAAHLLESTTEKNLHITLLEWNKKLWQKLLLSGGGRCNVTTGIFDKKILKEKYTRGFDFFENFLAKFSPKKCKKWFEQHHLPLKIEKDFRIFPVSNKSNDVLTVFEKIFKNFSQKISIKTEKKVLNVEKKWEKFLVSTQEEIFEWDILVLATGGNAYAHTGSRGDGYAFAKEFWHTITPLGPSLSSFLVEENFIKECSGISFSDAEIIFDDQKITGSLLLTHFGISGPLTFMLSSHLAWEKINHKKIFIKPLSRMDFAAWNNFLLEAFQQSPKRKITSILKEKLPQKFIEIVVKKFTENIYEKFVWEISRKDREYIAKLLGNGIEITLLDRRPWDEFVTAGGVTTEEIYENSWESRITENLYFAGEILNIDGYTGGFSLQICWSTGYVVASDIALKI